MTKILNHKGEEPPEIVSVDAIFYVAGRTRPSAVRNVTVAIANF